MRFVRTVTDRSAHEKHCGTVDLHEGYENLQVHKFRLCPANICMVMQKSALLSC